MTRQWSMSMRLQNRKAHVFVNRQVIKKQGRRTGFDWVYSRSPPTFSSEKNTKDFKPLIWEVHSLDVSQKSSSALFLVEVSQTTQGKALRILVKKMRTFTKSSFLSSFTQGIQTDVLQGFQWSRPIVTLSKHFTLFCPFLTAFFA